MPVLSRRGFLGGAAALAGVAATGGLAGCGSSVSISKDPDELVLWYWNRSISPSVLEQGAKQIPETDKHLRADVIGGTFDTKFRTSLAGGAYIPDISGINSNCSLYFPSEEQFIDFNDFGAADYKDQYFPWKWQLGVTPSDRMCFWPMDTGPTGFYYRADLFKKAGLPDDPEELSEAGNTWEKWIELGKKLKKDGEAFIISNASMIFSQYLNASPERYFDTENKPLYENEGNAVRQAWEVAIQAIDADITGNLQVSTDQNSAWVSGKTAGHIEAVWWAEILKDTAPDTSGNWRLASQPVKPGNSGGSFLTVPKTCKDPEAAFAFITWMTSPEKQADTFNEIQLFPSSPASFEGGTMKSGGDFFGPQDELKFFENAAEEVPTTFVSTHESQIGAFAKELTNVATSGKDSERAWDEAVAQTNRVLKKRGVI